MRICLYIALFACMNAVLGQSKSSLLGLPASQHPLLILLPYAWTGAIFGYFLAHRRVFIKRRLPV